MTGVFTRYRSTLSLLFCCTSSNLPVTYGFCAPERGRVSRDSTKIRPIRRFRTGMKSYQYKARSERAQAGSPARGEAPKKLAPSHVFSKTGHQNRARRRTSQNEMTINSYLTCLIVSLTLETTLSGNGA